MIHSPDVSVVLRTYTEERWDSLITGIEALQNQTKPPAEIVLVVDHNPLLLERVRATFPNVVVVENYHARGSPGAWNSGIAATKNEIVAFTDDDAVAAPNWLERLVLHYESPAVFGVGGTIEPIWEK